MASAGWWLWGWLTAVPGAAPCLPDRDSVPPGSVHGGTLAFDGRATLGDFRGTTTTMTGRMTGGATLRDVRGWVELPVAALRTGNGLRDGDLRRALEADRHPVVRFDLDGLSILEETADSVRVMLTGRFTIRGVVRDVGIPATVRCSPEGVRIRSSVPLNLNDYGVQRLSRLLGLFRMHPDIMVHVDLMFAPDSAAAPPAPAPDGRRPPSA